MYEVEMWGFRESGLAQLPIWVHRVQDKIVRVPYVMKMYVQQIMRQSWQPSFYFQRHLALH